MRAVSLRARRTALARRLSTVTSPSELTEVIASAAFPSRLDSALRAPPAAADVTSLASQRPEDVSLVLRAAMMTTHLHTQSRIASFEGKGYYTIGPCGEELLSAAALALRPTDPVALHYRHLSILIARQLQRGHETYDILLDRARGYATSTTDPVTGGVHCSLGADPAHDFLVTSTLASQGPQAVGRALAIEHLPSERWAPDAISFVSCGDGSINNSEWLSAVNAAEFIASRRRACPVLFGISDNGLSISFKTRGWTSKWVEQRLGMAVFRAEGTSLPALLTTARTAADYVRTSRQPATLLISNLPRRFGHAATDRQTAYLSDAQIAAATATDPVALAAAAAVHAGLTTSDALLQDYESIGQMAERAFAHATGETREMTREGLVHRTAPARPCGGAGEGGSTAPAAPSVGGDGKRRAKREMRTLMTRCLDEELGADPRLLYMGEDVEHGGY
jgi:2-oxoisovalerate dehydrogenase E1 component